MAGLTFPERVTSFNRGLKQLLKTHHLQLQVSTRLPDYQKVPLLARLAMRILQHYRAIYDFTLFDDRKK